MTQTSAAHRWLRRLRRMSVAAALLFLGQLLYAIGDTGGELGQTPPTLAWITLRDAKGINAWQYELAINRTADIFDPGSAFAALVVDFMWNIYKALVMIIIWFLDWVFSFDWLSIITVPLLSISEAIGEVLTAFGLVPVFLTIVALFAGIAFLRGRFANGIYEIVMACVIVALSGTVLGNPVMMVTGPDGWIAQTRDRTMELVAALGDQSSSDANAITSQLVEIFVRQPAQMISFGQILDGTSCEQVYDTAVAAGPYGTADDIRTAVGVCNTAAGQFADSPSGGMVTAVIMQSPATIIVLLLAVIIGGAVMLSLINAALAALKMMINLVFAPLPGGARRPLAQSFAEVCIALVTFVFSLFFLTIFLQIISTIFEASTGEPSKAFLVVNVFMVLGLVMFVAWRRKIKAATERWTEWLMKRPGGSAPRPLSSGGGRSAGTAAAVATVGAFKVLKTRQGRQAIKTAGVAGLAALTGNPALAGRMLFTAASKRAVPRPTTPLAANTASPTPTAPTPRSPDARGPVVAASTGHRAATTSSTAQMHRHSSRGEPHTYRLNPSTGAAAADAPAASGTGPRRTGSARRAPVASGQSAKTPTKRSVPRGKQPPRPTGGIRRR